MAKEHNPKGRIRVFLFELEGSDDTLLESVRSIAGAVGRTFAEPPARASVGTLPLAQGSGDPATAIGALLNDDPSSGGDDEAPEPVSNRTKRSRRFSSPKVVDLDSSGSASLKAFCERQGPRGHTNRYLVIATWWKDERAVDEISIHHIYTGYRVMGWNPPKDMGHVFRDGKKSGYFGNVARKGYWRITHIGAGRVLSPNMGSITS